MLLFDLGAAMAAVSMFAMVIVITVRHTAELYRDGRCREAFLGRRRFARMAFGDNRRERQFRPILHLCL
jgi:hypothetical protein